MPKFEKKAEVVEAWRTKGKRQVWTKDGARIAQPGMWIVVVSDGVHEILNDEEFKEKYSAKDGAAKKALSGDLKTLDEEVEEQNEAAAKEGEKAVEEDSKKEQKKKKVKKEKEDKK